MPAQLTYGSLSIGAYWALMGATRHPEFLQKTGLDNPIDDYQRIAPKTWKDKNRFVSLWPRMQFGNADQMLNAPITQDYGSYGSPYEPYSCDGEGTQTKRFIRGTCKDSGGVPVANAIVQGYRTNTDAFVGEVQANTDGTYALGMETIAGVQHYLVAYKPGSPDIAGTTVNTLTSTNVDGS